MSKLYTASRKAKHACQNNPDKSKFLRRKKKPKEVDLANSATCFHENLENKNPCYLISYEEILQIQNKMLNWPSILIAGLKWVIAQNCKKNNTELYVPNLKVTWGGDIPV